MQTQNLQHTAQVEVLTIHYKPTALKSPFGWVGGKRSLAKDIVGIMPPHNRYIEVFAGGLSVLYAKSSSRDLIEQRIKNQNNKSVATNKRYKYTEIINDINGDLINLHNVIKKYPQSLEIELSNMLCSREIFESIKKGVIKPRNDIQRASFYYYLLSFSFSSRGENGKA